MPRKNTKLTPGRKPGLSIREKVFVSAIASDPSKPTFANGVRAALSTIGDVKATPGSAEYEAANQLAVKLLKKDSVQAAIDRVLVAHKLTISDRAAALTDILHAKDHITTHTTKDSEGNISSVQEIISSNASDRIKTVDILNRMDGTYSRAANESQLHTKVLGTMLEEYSRKMRKVLQAESIPMVADSVDTESEQSEVQADSDDAATGQEQGIGDSLEGTLEGTESSREGRG
jgi:hypothetical protein